MSSSQPARLTFSLHTLASHGGGAGNTHDGWGVAFYQGNDVALFREPAAAGDSALVRHLESPGPSTNLAILHIRRATHGAIQLSNTQPFVRELGGRTHVFAHNGHLPGVMSSAVMAGGLHRPVGETDSEYAFCALLARLSILWDASNPPSLKARLSVLAWFASDLRTFGPANFLYADGDALFAHGHRRIQRASGQTQAPGLWILQRHCTRAEPATEHHGGVSVAADEQVLGLIASVQLSDAAWRPLAEGELVAVRAGEEIHARLAQ